MNDIAAVELSTPSVPLYLLQLRKFPHELRTLQDFRSTPENLGKNPVNTYDWALGWDTSLSTEKGTLDEIGSAERRVKRIESLRHMCERESDAHTEDEARANIRLLRVLLKESATGIGIEPVKKGEGIVSFSLGGIKNLNDHVIGNDQTTGLIQKCQEILENTLRETDLIGLAALPSQQIWKQYSVKIEGTDPFKAAAKIKNAEDLLKKGLHSYIVTHFSADKSKEIEKTLQISVGSSFAKENQENGYDLLRRSIISVQTASFLTSLSPLREKLKENEYFKGDPQLEAIRTQLNTDMSHKEEEDRTLHAVTLTASLRDFIIDKLSSHPEMVQNIKGESGEKMVFSQKFLGILRKNDQEGFSSLFPSLSNSEREILFNFSKAYTQGLEIPILIKYFTEETSQSHIEKIGKIRGLSDKLLGILKKETNRTDDDKKILKEAWDIVLSDQRYLNKNSEAQVTSSCVFDNEALRFPSAHYINFDIRGLGAELLNAYQKGFTSFPKNLTYDQFLEKSKTWEEIGWRKIHQTFDFVLKKLNSQFPRSGGSVGKIRGDEGVFILSSEESGGVNSKKLLDFLYELQKSVTRNKDIADVRLSVVTADTFRDVSSPVAHHLKTVKIVEEDGSKVAKDIEANSYFGADSFAVVTINPDAHEFKFNLGMIGIGDTEGSMRESSTFSLDSYDRQKVWEHLRTLLQEIT